MYYTLKYQGLLLATPGISLIIIISVTVITVSHNDILQNLCINNNNSIISAWSVRKPVFQVCNKELCLIVRYISAQLTETVNL